MTILTKTFEIKDRILHLDLVLPKNFKSKKVRVVITSDDEIEVKNSIKNLKGKLKFTEKQYNDVQEFLKEDR